jgi:hypothetical protein
MDGTSINRMQTIFRLNPGTGESRFGYLWKVLIKAS